MSQYRRTLWADGSEEVENEYSYMYKGSILWGNVRQCAFSRGVMVISGVGGYLGVKHGHEALDTGVSVSYVVFVERGTYVMPYSPSLKEPREGPILCIS